MSLFPAELFRFDNYLPLLLRGSEALQGSRTRIKHFGQLGSLGGIAMSLTWEHVLC